MALWLGDPLTIQPAPPQVLPPTEAMEATPELVPQEEKPLEPQVRMSVMWISMAAMGVNMSAEGQKNMYGKQQKAVHKSLLVLVYLFLMGIFAIC